MVSIMIHSMLGNSGGYMTLLRDHFGVVRFVAGPFWSGPFCQEFYENNYFIFFLLFPIFSYKKISVFLFSFFSKTVKDFLFIFKKFLSTLHKKYKLKHTTTVFFFFGYSSSR